MSKGRYQNNTRTKKKTLQLVLSLMLLIVLCVIAVAIYFRNSDSIPAATDAPNDIQIENRITEDNDQENVTTNESVDADSEDETEETTFSTEVIETIPTQAPIVIVARKEAEYEKWLGASLVVCVSMEYPDFQLEGIYTSSATSMEDKFDSDGVYIVFSSGNSRMAIHSKALQQERKASGSVDISSETIGFATFDRVKPDSVASSTMEQIDIEALGELIAQSLLVSIYYH